MARLPVVTGLFLLALAHVAMSITVQEYFPNIKNNLTKITWAHAVNSKADLERALNSSDVMMIEADVTMGTVIGAVTPNLVPIMAHPPKNTSDLALSEFLKLATKKTNNTKGIKLDFKSTEAFLNSTPIILATTNPSTPVWVNADILRGPNSTDDQKTVNPVHFLQAAQNLGNMMPTISIGWTTGYQPHSQNMTSGNYTRQQIDEMLNHAKTVKTNQSITYPVRACYAANNIELMQSLLANTSSVNNPTLTIWSHKDDKVDPDKLSLLVRTIGVAKVFVDVPKDLLMKLNFNSAFTAQSSAFVVFASMMFALFTAKLL